MTTTHMDEGALVRWLDGEAVGEERRDLAAHLSACMACEARLTTLKDQAALVSRALVAADWPRSHRRPRAGWGLRIAAGFAVLLGVGLAVEPVRAWILERAETVWTVITGDRGPVPSVPAGNQTPGGAAAAGSITFVPAGEVFELEVISRQAGGRLLIETVDAGAASATVEGGTGAEGLVVLPSGLRIVNDAASHADYVVHLPVGLRAIVLAVAGGPRQRYEPRAVGERWTVPLAAEAGTGGR